MDINKTLSSYNNKGSIVFTHDILNGTNENFKHAACIYSEPSWRAGFNKFMSRAGKEKGGYKKYLLTIKEIINQLKVPTFMIIGKHMRGTLDPDNTIDCMIHGYPALLAIWYAEIPDEELKTNYDASDYVCKKYNRILNFSCGYGGTVNDAKKYNKQFICSDVNGKCIYYIAKEFMGYEYGL